MLGKQQHGVRRKLLTATMAALAAGMVMTPSHAQDASELEEITVTGSRIRAISGMSEPTPVTAVSPDELLNFNPGSTVAEQLDNLPQFFATPTAQRGGNAISTTAGGSYLNLRGMGLNRTLVLLNGSRIIPADANGSVNVDNFPQALMQRVDVVTGGASAAYGADAVAGVVNFVLDREFTGFKSRVSAGITEEMDGENYAINLAAGRGFFNDRLHLIGSIDARQIDQIGPDEHRHDNWKEWGHVRNPNWVSATATPNEPTRITVPYVFSAQSSPQGLIFADHPDFAYDNWTFTDDAQGIRPYAFGDYLSLTGAGAQRNQSGGHEYAYNRLATERGVRGNDVAQRNFFFGAQYELSDSLSIHGQTIWGRTESNFYGQPSNITIPSPSYQWTIFRENPYLPQVLTDEMDRLGLEEINVIKTGTISGPGLVNIYDNRGDRSIGQLQSHTIGFEFNMDNGWQLTGNYQRGESKVSTGILNVPRIDKHFMAMDAVRHPVTGEIVCNVSVVNPSPAELDAFMEGKIVSSPITPDGVEVDSPVGPFEPSECVPFNPFGIGNANLEAKRWVEDEEKKHYRVLEQDFAELLLTGEVHEGWGAGPVAIATGLTWRDEEFTQQNFPAYGERGLANAPELGIRGIPVGFANAGNRSLHPFSAIGVGGGDNSVWEWFGEANVPIWEWTSGQRLGSTIAYRSSEYDKAGRQESWKLGFDATLTEDLRWRITKSQDIREPNFAELYLTTTGGGAVDDPLLNERNASLTSLGAPNTELSTETGDTITTGFVYQPTFAPWVEGLQISLDWYEINLEGAVNTYGIQRIVDDCFNTGAPSACRLISRDAETNVITRILNQYVNAGNAQTRGVDMEIQYRMEPDFFGTQSESLSFRGFFGYLAENSTTTQAGTTEDLADTIGRPEYTATLTANYNIGPWGVMLQGLYDHGTMLNRNWVEGVDVDDNRIPSYTMFNLATSYSGELNNGAAWRAAFNITNLLDRAPPPIPGAGGQSYSNSHDELGRRYNLSLSLDF